MSDTTPVEQPPKSYVAKCRCGWMSESVSNEDDALSAWQEHANNTSQHLFDIVSE